MSYIDNLGLNMVYARHDDRELWDSEPLFLSGPHYSRFFQIAKGTRVKATPPGQVWWPSSSFFGDETLGDCTVMPPAMADNRVDVTGNAGFPYRIRGIAQDSDSVGVGGAKMHLFRTSDDAFQYETVSVGPSGQYDFGTDDNTTQFYVVGYRTGPDIAGTSVNTLTGS
jgi:hypothetical protein